MTKTEVERFFYGDPIPTAKFPSVGSTVSGTIVDLQTAQQQEYGTRKPLFWDDGKPRMQLIITLQTEERNGPDDDGRRKLFVMKGVQVAVRDALTAAGVREPLVGGWISVTWDSEKPSDTPGYNPMKVYTAEYRPPAPLEDII